MNYENKTNSKELCRPVMDLDRWIESIKTSYSREITIIHHSPEEVVCEHILRMHKKKQEG